MLTLCDKECKLYGLRHVRACMYGFRRFRRFLLNRAVWALANSQSVNCREFVVVHALHLLNILSLDLVLPKRVMSLRHAVQDDAGALA